MIKKGIIDFVLPVTLIVSVVGIVLVSCSSGSVAGGTSTETTNGITVITSAGVPAAGAIVSVVDGSGWVDSIALGRSPVSEQGMTDGNGKVSLRASEGTRTVHVRLGDQSAIVSGNSSVVRLSESVPLTGMAVGADSVRIGGTNLVVPVLSDGSFRFESVPSGLLTAYRQSGRTLSNGITLSSVDSSEVHVVPALDNRLLFDDFTGGFNLNPIAPISGGVEWFSFSDSVHRTLRDLVWRTDSLSSHKGNSGIAVNSELGTAALRVQLGSGTIYPYAGFGARLGNGRRGFNLSTMSTLAIRVRGTGTVRVSLESRLHDSLGISQYSVPISLDSTWKMVQIPISDFHLAVKDSLMEKSYPWESGAHDIRRLEFLFRGTENVLGTPLDCEIDAIYFDGVKFPL